MVTQQWRLISRLIVALLLAGLFVMPTAPTVSAQEAITIEPNAVPQGSTVIINLSGFRPNEIVTLWQTLPDFSVVGHGNVEVDESGKATLSWTVGAGYETGHHYMSARGNTSKRVAITDFMITLGEGSLGDTPMSVSTTRDPQGSTFRFSSVGFSSREIVSVWMRTPSNRVLPLEATVSSKEGTFDYTLRLGGPDQEGEYHLTARGNESGKTAIVAFVLERGDLLIERANRGAVVKVAPTTLKQGDALLVEGMSFGGDEDVAVWFTRPDAVTVPFFEINTSSDGYFVEEMELPTELTTGKHELTCYGKDTGLRVVTEIYILPR